MALYTLPPTWQLVAPAGSTGVAQLINSATVKLTLSAGPPAANADGFALYDGNAVFHFGAPLPNDLYACTISTTAGILDIMPVGSMAAMIGAITDPPWAGSGTATVISLLKAIAQNGLGTTSGSTTTGSTSAAGTADFSKSSNSGLIAALAA